MIKIIRSFTVVVMFAAFGAGALVISGCIFPFQKKKEDKYKVLQKSWQFFIWLIKKLKVIKVKSDDIEKIKNIRNSIIVSTHPSFIDIVILMSIIPYSTCFVAEKLSRNPFLKGIVNVLFIPETDSVDKWLNKSIEALEDNMNLIIFPMGGRHDKNDFPKIRKGASLIAQKTGRNIVALNIDTDTKFLQTHQPIYQAGHKPVEYTISYLTEIKIADFLEKYPDEVTFKTEITKMITKILYKQ